MAPEHRRSRRGSGQALPGVRWVYVPQSSASDLLQSLGMTNIPEVWQHLCVGRWKGYTSLQQLHVESLGCRATLPQSRHFSFLTTSTSPGAGQLSIRPGGSWVEACPPPGPYLSRIHSSSPAPRSHVQWPLSRPRVGSSLSSHTPMGS